MDREEALRLCDGWLPLWTGNGPDELIAVHAEDVLCRDPANPDGIEGKAALLGYFRKLPAAFPDWVWRADDVFLIEGGFTLRRWRAEIPVTGKVIHERGLDLVLVEGGLVTRNEVSFDRSGLPKAMGR